MNIKSTCRFKILLIMVLAVLFVMGAQKSSKATTWSEPSTFYCSNKNNLKNKSFSYPSGTTIKSSITLYKFTEGSYEIVNPNTTTKNSMQWDLEDEDSISVTYNDYEADCSLNVNVKSTYKKKYQLEVVCKKIGSNFSLYGRKINILINQYTGTLKLTYVGADDKIYTFNTLDADSEGKVTLPNDTPTKEGFTFDGWMLYDNGREKGNTGVQTVYKNGNKVYVGCSDIELRAKWKSNMYTIYFYSSDSNGKILDSQDIVYGIETKLIAFSNMNYSNGQTFLGWNAQREDGTWYGTEDGIKGWFETPDEYYLYKDQAKVSQTVKAGESVTMHAVWANSDGGGNNNPEYNGGGSTGGTGAKSSDNDSNNTTGVCTIKFYKDMDGEELGTQEIEYTDGSKATSLKTIDTEKDGCVFKGWYAQRETDTYYYGYKTKGDESSLGWHESVEELYIFKKNDEINSIVEAGETIYMYASWETVTNSENANATSGGTQNNNEANNAANNNASSNETANNKSSEFSAIDTVGTLVNETVCSLIKDETIQKIITQIIQILVEVLKSIIPEVITLIGL